MSSRRKRCRMSPEPHRRMTLTLCRTPRQVMCMTVVKFCSRKHTCFCANSNSALLSFMLCVHVSYRLHWFWDVTVGSRRYSHTGKRYNHIQLFWRSNGVILAVVHLWPTKRDCRLEAHQVECSCRYISHVFNWQGCRSSVMVALSYSCTVPALPCSDDYGYISLPVVCNISVHVSRGRTCMPM